MKAAVFNPYLDTLGGGERYTMGAIRTFEKAGYKVEVEWQNDTILRKLEKRFGMKLTNTTTVSSINRGDGFDACFWVSDGSVPTLRSRNNILHFQVPFKNVGGKTLINRMKLFRVNCVVCNSGFTKNIVDREFAVNSKVIYPPVSVREFKPRRKQNIVSYIGRFSKLIQSKRQDVLISVFKKFHRKNSSWKLVLAGGVEVGNDGFSDELAKLSGKYPVEIVKSPKFSEVREILGVSKMFWSAAGYGISEESEPQKIEHFGITAVEAMAAKAVPLLHAKGGFKEIVSNGDEGFLWNKKNELLNHALEISSSFSLWHRLSRNAHEKSKEFSAKRFEEEFLKLLK